MKMEKISTEMKTTGDNYKRFLVNFEMSASLTFTFVSLSLLEALVPLNMSCHDPSWKLVFTAPVFYLGWW